MGWTRQELGIELRPHRVFASVLTNTGKMIDSILDNPLPALLQIGGAAIGIPPYVTSAAITAARGGDLKDIAKSAAVSYVTSDFLQSTQMGADIRNYTSNLVAGDVTDYMIENYDISIDQAINVAKISTAALNGAVVGGIRATLLGDSIATGIGTGFSQGLVYSGVDSYFDELNKDPNWGYSPKALNMMKGATSTALNTLISGKGDPAAAVGNYIAYASLKLGASEARTALQRAHEDFSGKTDEARKAQEQFLEVKAEFDSEVRRHDALAELIRAEAQEYESTYNSQMAPIQRELDRMRSEFEMQKIIHDREKQSFEQNKYAYENYGEWAAQNGYQPNTLGEPPYKITGALRHPDGSLQVSIEYRESYDTEMGWSLQPVEVPIPDGSVRDENGNPITKMEFAPSRDSFREAAEKAAAAANRSGEIAQATAQEFQALAESDSTRALADRLAALGNSVQKNSESLRVLRDDLEKPTGGMENPNLAQRLQFAAQKYDNKFNLYKASEEAKNKAAEIYNNIVAEVTTRDATIDAINAGAITVTGRTPDGGFMLDNGMVIKDGKFFQNDAPVFTNASGIMQNALEVVDTDGQIYRYGMDAGRQMSSTDIQNVFRRDYQIEISDAEARRFTGGAYGTYDQQKFDNFAKDRAQQTYRMIAGQPASQEQLQQFVQTPNSQQAASNAAVAVVNKNDSSIVDNNQALAVRENAARQVISSYQSQGLTPEQIDERISSGQANKDMQDILARERATVDQQIAAVKAAQETYGTDSPEFKNAYRTALDSMARYGGFDVSRNADGSYNHGKIGKIDPNTLVPVDTSRSYTDPITGRLHIHVSGTADGGREMIQAKDIVSLWAIGNSANPPSTGGVSLFGDGSGSTEGLPAITLIAVDNGAGDQNAKMFDLGNGFALISYSDGRTKLVDKAGQVFLMTEEEAAKAIKDLPVVTSPTVKTDGGKTEESPGEKALGKFADVLTDPQLQKQLYPTVQEPTKPTPEEPLSSVLTPGPEPTKPIEEVKPPEEPKPVEPMPEEVKPTEPEKQQPGAAKPEETQPVQPTQPAAPRQQVTPTTPTTPTTPAEQQPTTTQPTTDPAIEKMRTDLTKAIEDAKAAGATDTQAVKDAVAAVASQVGTTQATLLSQLGKTEEQLRTEVASQVGGVEKRLSEAIAQARQSGLEGDAALQSGINKVASDVGATKEQLLSQLGKTETQLRADMQAQVGGVESRLAAAIDQARQSGLQGDAALQAGINKVASDLNTTKDIVLGQVGKTEQQLRSDFALQLGGVQQQIGQVQSDLNKAIADAKAAGASDVQAVREGLASVSAKLGTTEAALLSQLGTSEQALRQEFSTGLAQAQAQLSQEMQSQYQQLSAAQKAEVDARVQQGQNLNQAIQAVGAQTAAQLAQSETALRAAIGQLGANVQGQFDQMSAAQKAEVAARVQQGQDLQGAIQNVSTQTAQQLAQTETALRQAIGQLGTDVQNQFNSMDAAQKAEVQARVQQGQDLQAAIANVGAQTEQKLAQTQAGLEAAIGRLGSDVQSQFAQMDAAQKAEVAARVQQGQDLQGAIANVGAATAQQIAQSEAGLRAAIGQLGTNVQGQFDAMTAAQKAEVAARVQQGQDLQTAISNVGTQTQQQIAASETAMREALGQLGTDVRTQFDQMSQAQKAEVTARMQQGQDLQTAIQNVGQQAAQQLTEAQAALRGQITTLGEGLQRQYNEMSDAQRAEVAARVEQGQKLDTAISAVGTQIGQVEEKLTTNIEDIRKKIEAENARKLAAEQAAAAKSQQEKLLQKAAANVAVPGAGGAGAAEGPLPQAQFRSQLTTGEAKDTEFKGPLEEFLKKVETTSYTAPPGQPMQQPTQPTQVAQQQAAQPAQQGPNYYSYGVFNEIDQILNPLSSAMPSMFAKSGGLATPMFAQGGLNVVHHSGKQRLDFRQGAAVSGPGDGQSDDIPAMLADGEFVFPADVVAALGNGSTKAGSDKLYDMMHSIRAYHRSAKPEDLPPPAKKSPLDYLKKARR